MKQKDVFLQLEGDAWIARNRTALERVRLPDDDPLLRELVELIPSTPKPNVLEIGCGDGTRLAWIHRNLAANCWGVEPSAVAVTEANAKGVTAHQGTAEALPFEDRSMDVVMFGFCLYLCDREDLARIASEADRVLRSSGWLLILDFFSPVPTARPYHHRPGIVSYKMDYRTLFSWHPDYLCMTHKVRHHQSARYTDDPNEWVAVSVFRKHQADDSY
jgi:ubiquinone/menaquinone biosynthesis C-methylase UbiE